MREVSTDEARMRLSDLIDAVLKGEEVVITVGGKRAVRIVPVRQTSKRRYAGSAHGLISISDDFDAPLEDFAEYVQ